MSADITALEHRSYRAGIFANDGDDEIGITDTSYFPLLALGRDLSQALSFESAAVRLDYLHHNQNR